MMRRMKKVSALILAVSLLCSAFVLPEVYAAVGIDSTKKCSVQVNCKIQNDTAWNELSGEKYLSELETNAVEVKLYKVANISVTGKYTELDDFSELDLSDTRINSETSAATWQELAAAAKTAVVDKALETELVKSTGEEGTCTFTDLDQGLYLVMASKESTNRYRYEFSPYLVSLPSNNYYKIAKAASEANPPQVIPENADEWIYNLTGDNAVGLKPERFPRYGYLKIEKDVPTLNIETPGEVFVYEVTATLDNKVVYNDVVAIDYNKQHYAFVGPILADADVVVEEVYKGASYTLVSSSALNTIVQAETYFDDCKKIEEVKEKAALITEDDIENELIFKFTNEHNNVPNGGTGVVNAISPSGMTQDYQGQDDPASDSPN